jgi:hypothetical protein
VLEFIDDHDDARFDDAAAHRAGQLALELATGTRPAT